MLSVCFTDRGAVLLRISLIPCFFFPALILQMSTEIMQDSSCPSRRVEGVKGCIMLCTCANDRQRQCLEFVAVKLHW